MNAVGHFTLQWVMIVALVGAVAGIIGQRRRDNRLIELGRRTAILTALLLTFAESLLLRAILTNDFSVLYVANYSSRTLPLLYKFTALWAGQSGSLLFWAWLLSIATAIFIAVHWRGSTANRAQAATATTILQAVLLFFLAILLFVSPPFEPLGRGIIADGHGMNPLLQNPWMAVHPPVLFLGYVGLAVPFAIMLAGLIHKRFDAPLVIRSRSWTLVAWCFLSVGIVLGGYWAYLELGWGGYWAWDPVENASLMPWLTATALLHLLIVQQRLGMFKSGSLLLAAGSFVLTIFGTYLTRSGILSSLHTFAPNFHLGVAFLALIVVAVAVTVGIMIWRRHLLQPEHHLEAFVSREMAFLLTAVLFVLLALVVFGGTTLPLWTRLSGRSEVTVGGSFYNSATGPLFLLVLLLMGMAPVLPWRQAESRQLGTHLGIPAAIALVVGAFFAVNGVRSLLALAGYSLACFTVITLVVQLALDTAERRGATGENPVAAVIGSLRQRRRRYGGLLAHVAMVFIFVGVIASSFHKSEQTATLQPSQSLRITDYELRYEKLDYYRVANADVVGARISVYRDGRQVGTLTPEKRLYQGSDNVMTEASRRSTPWQDLYVVLAGISGDDRVTIQAFVNPLVGWIWWSCFLLVAGVLLALIPVRQATSSPATATVIP